MHNTHAKHTAHTCIVMAAEMLKQDPRVINTCAFGLHNMGSDCRQHAAPSSLACHCLLPALPERSGPWKVTCKVIWRALCSCVKGLVTNARNPNNSTVKNLSTLAKSLHGVCVCTICYTVLCCVWILRIWAGHCCPSAVLTARSVASQTSHLKLTHWPSECCYSTVELTLKAKAVTVFPWFHSKVTQAHNIVFVLMTVLPTNCHLTSVAV